MRRSAAPRLFAANFLAAFALLAVFKAALVWYAASGAEGETSGPRMAGKFFLCLGWDVVGAALVAALVVLVAAAVAGRGGRRALMVSGAIQALHGLYLAINHEVAKVTGAPLEKAAIDLGFFNAETGHGAAPSFKMASSIAPYLTTTVALEVALGVVGSVLAVRFVLTRVDRWIRFWPLGAAVAGALFLTSVALLPGLANGRAAIHTYGLERSPVPLIAGSYLRAPMRRLVAAEAPPADPFCLDLSVPPQIAKAVVNPLRAARPQRTNVVLVVLESIGVRSLRHDPFPMPALRSLGQSANGIEFAHHYSHWPQTMKAMFTLLCSELPHPHYTPITYTNPAVPCVSLSEALKANGYDTALYESGDLAFDREIRFYKHRKFDALVDRNLMPGHEGAWSNSWGIDERVTVRALKSWIDDRPAGKPYLAVYKLVTGHHPYEYPDAPFGHDLDSEGEARAQRDTFRFIDDRVRELVDFVRARGELDRTLFVVVSDHGPGSGRPGMGRVRDASVYEGSVRVPFTLSGPQLAGVTGPVDFPTAHLDVAPTILGLLGIEPPLTMKGRDLTRQSDERAIVFSTRPPLSQIGVRAGRWKAIQWEETGVTELFDIVADPDERKDLFADHQPLARTLVSVGLRWQTHSRHLIENYAAVLPSARRCP